MLEIIDRRRRAPYGTTNRQFLKGRYLKTKSSQVQTYHDYSSALKSLTRMEDPATFPKIIALSGPSDFLRQKAVTVTTSSWQVFGCGGAQKIEASDLDQSSFLSLWSQRSLFESRALYVVRRCSSIKSIADWLAGITSEDLVKSNLLLDFGERISVDVLKQLKRLNALQIQCVEPTATAEFEKIVMALVKRFDLKLETDGALFLLGSVGRDLSRIENEIEKLALVFAGETRTLSRSDVAGVIGGLKEEDVFSLFQLLRQGRSSMAGLVADLFLVRGESAIAINGILARYAREKLESNNPARGIAGLLACAEADRRLKSNSLEESLAIGTVIDDLFLGQ
jgi:DNA polymerase III delta subunit